MSDKYYEYSRLFAQMRANLPVYEVKPQLRPRGESGATVHTGLYDLVEAQPGGATTVVGTGGHDDMERLKKRRERPVQQIFNLPQEIDLALDAYLAARAGEEGVTKQAVLSGLVVGLLEDNAAAILRHLGSKEVLK